MRRLALVAGVVATAVTTTVAASSTSCVPLVDQGRQVRTMAAGDSITVGTFGQMSYRGALAELAYADDIHLRYVGPYEDGPRPPEAWWPRYHAAVNGRVSTVLADQAPWLAGHYAPEVVLVLIGQNDVRMQVPPAHVGARIRETVDAFLDVGATVFVATVPQRYDEYAAETFRAAINDRIRAMGSLEGVNVVELNLDARDTADGVHPNVLGEIRLAAAWHEIMTGCGELSPAGGADVFNGYEGWVGRARS